MGGIVREMKGSAININGVEDHVVGSPAQPLWQRLRRSKL
jgi:hypothetical protein